MLDRPRYQLTHARSRFGCLKVVMEPFKSGYMKALPQGGIKLVHSHAAATDGGVVVPKRRLHDVRWQVAICANTRKCLVIKPHQTTVDVKIYESNAAARATTLLLSAHRSH